MYYESERAKMYKISVIIPCYNVEKIVSRCLESVLAQSIGYENLEIIIVDDKSTDNTVSILEDYEKRYPENIMLIKCDTNGKQGTARNIGLMYATGEYISFVDADDMINSRMYEILLGIIEESKCEIVQFRYKGIVGDGKQEEIENVSYDVHNFTDSVVRKKYMLNSAILNESCTQKIYSRELILKSGVGFAEGVSYEEPLFTYPLKFFVEKVAVTETPLYYYIYNENGTTASYMSKPSKILEHLDVQAQAFEFVKGLGVYEEYKDEVDLYILHSFYVETFYFMKYRGYNMPVALFRYMCKWVMKNIPESLNNMYLSDKSLEKERQLVLLIDGKLLNNSDDVIQRELDEVMNELQ